MNKPKIRFKGFEGEWNSPSIEKVFEVRNGYTPSKSVESYWIGGTIPWFRMEDIRASGGFLEDSIQHITPKAVKNNGLFEKDSIIMATTATIGVHAQLIADSLANQRFTNFSIRKSLREGIIAKYVYYAFFGIDEWAVKNTNSGGLLSVNMPFLLKHPFFVPSLPEQRALASYFTSLDAQIAASTSRLSSLKQIKAASLLNMFPQKGEMVPRVRFKGFQGEWKEIKLGEIFSVEIGEFVIKTKQKNNAPYPVYNGGVSNTGFYDCYNQEGPKIIVSARGANAGYVNYCTTDFWAGNSCYSIGAKNNDELKFFFYFLKRFQEIYMKNQYSASIPSISKQQILRTNLIYPSLPEQRAIASYFTALDAQITLHRERLEKLKQIKAACLEKMFA